ncbi:MAG: putative toxin-antitoxin system toxin component, PIN family [Acidimicrobiales bacterium]|nr:putative toxin-antitoxin system toxin component, PIN family [Acidimicrobiales bacterium]
MRVVLDVNIYISALLNRNGPLANVIRAWLLGNFEVVVSPKLLEELERALNYRKLQKRILPSEVHQLLRLVRFESIISKDAEDTTTIRSADPGDDYLIVLAQTTR